MDSILLLGNYFFLIDLVLFQTTRSAIDMFIPSAYVEVAVIKGTKLKARNEQRKYAIWYNPTDTLARGFNNIPDRALYKRVYYD
jgi:hypothetical protein